MVHISVTVLLVPYREAIMTEQGGHVSWRKLQEIFCLSNNLELGQSDVPGS